jgi:hypothetical protein
MNLLPNNRARGKAAAIVACVAAVACSGDPQHAPALILDTFPSDRVDSGTTPRITQDAGPALLDKDTFTGERRTFKVTLGRMLSPKFTWPENLVPLTKPTTVHYPSNKYDYVLNYDPSVVNMFANVPASSDPHFAMVSDVDGGNGILNSVFVAYVPPAAAAPSLSWDLPVTTFKSLDDIYASLGLVIDPSFAQVIVSASTGVNGDIPVQKAVVSTKGATAQTILYDTIGGTFTDTMTSTGPLGLAIIVNMNAVGLEYPGKWFPLYITVNGNTQSTVPQFPVVKDSVSRVYWVQGGLEGN